LLKRLRSRSEVRAYETVRTVDGYETMTPTQACRFRELQLSRHGAKAQYSLEEAARLLHAEADDLLESAAAGRLQCFVAAKGLRGHWLTAGDGDTCLTAQPAMPEFLALCAEDCRQIAQHGGVNVYELEYPAGPVSDERSAPTLARFVLREPIWVDRKRIVLKHPLPK
jgi:hypothetical protein